MNLQFQKTFEEIRSAVDPFTQEPQFFMKKVDFFEVNSDIVESSTRLSASTKSGGSTLENNSTASHFLK